MLKILLTIKKKNFKLKKSYWCDLLNKIVQNPKYGYQDLGTGKKVNIEFVDSNNEQEKYHLIFIRKLKNGK